MTLMRTFMRACSFAGFVSRLGFYILLVPARLSTGKLSTVGYQDCPVQSPAGSTSFWPI